MLRWVIVLAFSQAITPWLAKHGVRTVSQYDQRDNEATTEILSQLCLRIV